MNCQKYLIKSGIKSVIVFKKHFKVNQYTTKNITKVKSYEGKISTSFHDDAIPKADFYCIYLSVTFIDSVFKIGKNYYSQVYLEECKYIVKEKRQAITLVMNWKFFLKEFLDV